MARTVDRLPITGDDEADKLLVDDPMALLLGMMLDQQVPMEWAFRSPARLKERLGGRLDPAEMSAMDPDDLVAAFTEKPGLHRFPGSMAKRAHQLATHLVEHHGGDPADVWASAASGEELFDRLKTLPGYGEEKARIFLALLAKRLDRAPAGWEAHAGPFADDQPRSVADIDSREAFAQVRQWKKAKKAEGKSKAD